MKHVLCLLRTFEPELLTEIYVCAKKYDWILEISGSWLGPGWFGDGIITDYFSIEELSFIQNINSIPIVSREVHTEPNVRSVIGDTNKIAELVYQHFCDKGYKNYAAIHSREWDGGLPNIPHDPIKAYQNLLEKKGILLHQCFWDPQRIHESKVNYFAMMEILTNFFISVPKPIALFVPNECYLGTLYRIFSNLKLQVPEDIAVLCNTDSVAITENTSVKTSSICGANKETGRKMCALLERMMNGEDVPQYPLLVTPAAVLPQQSTDVLIMPDSNLTRAVKFLQQNYHQFISIKDAAEYAGCSVCLLNRKMQRYLGKSTYQFLLELRINKVQELLDNTSLSLEQIAVQTGYGSKMSLSFAFKRVTGMTPGKYREGRLVNKSVHQDLTP